MASRSRDDYTDQEVIPVVGSYELRSLSRSHPAAASAAAGMHAAHRSPNQHAAHGGSINAVYPPDLVAPDASLLGRHMASGSVPRGLGSVPVARRASFASSEAFGGTSALSVAGSDDGSQSQARAALPPLASLPRISRAGAPLLPAWRVSVWCLCLIFLCLMCLCLM